MMTNGLWRFFGGTLVAASLVTACGSSGDDEELPGATGGSAGAAAGKGGSAGSTGGAAGKGGTGGSTGGTAGAAGKGGSAGSTGGTGGSAGTAGKGGTGGSTGGTGGTAGTAGKGGTGGSTGGTGGTAGKGGTGGSTGGTAGTAGKGGSGGSTAGSGGSTAGSGGSTAGSGGSTAGSGGSTAGSGGSTAGSGGSTAGSGGSTAGSGGSTAGAGGAGGSCGPFGCGTGGGAGTAGTGGSTGSCDKTDPSVDADGDGYFPPVDCNDCDPNTNPGALDIVNLDSGGNPVPTDQQVDEDCSGTATQPGDTTTCDTGLVFDSTDPMDGARAMDICQIAQDSPKTWGVIDAKYQQIDGAALTPAAAVGYGIQAGWGPNVKTQLGANMLVVSSGTARLPGQTGYQDPSGANKNYNTANPPGVPFAAKGCTGNPQTGALHDSVELQLKLRAPTNAKSFSFKFKFYTYEFPVYVCSQYNDVFLARMTPPPPGLPPTLPNLNNISFDSSGQPLSVNNALLDVCKPQTAGGKVFDCLGNVNELDGTGYEGHGATSWLQTTAPVDPGSEFTLRVGATDAGDGALATTALVDDFQWSANPGTVQTGNACKLGGTGSCSQCVQGASNPALGAGCCAKQYDDCKAGACDDILSCVGVCGGNKSCQQACYDSFPAGQPGFDTLYQCYYATVTPDPKDKGACGIVCGFQNPLGTAGSGRAQTSRGRASDPGCSVRASSVDQACQLVGNPQ